MVCSAHALSPAEKQTYPARLRMTRRRKEHTRIGGTQSPLGTQLQLLDAREPMAVKMSGLLGNLSWRGCPSALWEGLWSSSFW